MKQLAEHRTKADNICLLGKGAFEEPANKKRVRPKSFNIERDLSVTKHHTKFKNAMKQLAEHRTKADNICLLGKGAFEEPANKKRVRPKSFNIERDLSVTKHHTKFKNAMKQLAEHRTKADNICLLGKGAFGEPVNKKRVRKDSYNIGEHFQADLSVTEHPSEDRADIKLVVHEYPNDMFRLVPESVL